MQVSRLFHIHFRSGCINQQNQILQISKKTRRTMQSRQRSARGVPKAPAFRTSTSRLSTSRLPLMEKVSFVPQNPTLFCLSPAYQAIGREHIKKIHFHLWNKFEVFEAYIFHFESNITTLP